MPVRVDGELFGLHLASETSEGKVSLYAGVYLPIYRKFKRFFHDEINFSREGSAFFMFFEVFFTKFDRTTCI